MKKLHVVKRIATAMLTVAMLFGIAVPVSAAKVSNTGVVEMGVPAKVALSLDKTEQTGEIVRSWTYKFAPVSKDTRLFFNVYDEPAKGVSDEVARMTGSSLSWRKDSEGRWRFETDWNYNGEGTKEKTFYNSRYTMGKKVVRAYLFDPVAYNAAVRAAGEAAEKAREEAYKKITEAYNAERQKAYDAWYAANKDLPYEQWPEFKEPERPEYPSYDDYYNEPYIFDYISVSDPVTIDVKKQAGCSTKVTSNSVQISMSCDDTVTGYEVYRKVGSSYKKIAKVAKDVYKDTGLASKTAYTYKVRPYYYNQKTNKTYYGVDTIFDAITAGGPLKLKASISGSKNVKLSWTKVPGAVKYEVYRSAAYSASSEVSQGRGNGYSLGKLIKTLKKSAKSYTDNKTSLDRYYSYTVKAVLDNGTKLDITESIGVNLGFGEPSGTAEYTNAKGDKTVEWRKVPSADGYVLEKNVKDPATGNWEWVEQSKINKSKTKLTVKAPKPVKDKDGYWITSEEYRIRAYKKKGNTVSAGYFEFTVDATLGLVGGVTAKKTDNGVKVSWDKVPGAAYYKVYRVREGALTKNKDKGSYTLDNGYWNAITEYVGYKEPVAVDVAKWNADRKAEWKAYYDAKNDDKVPDLPRPAIMENYLDEDNAYYYQNYEYTRNIFTETSMMDYSGEVYSSDVYQDTEWSWDSEKQESVYTKHGYQSVPQPINERRDYRVGPVDGISYQYYVVAYMDEAYTASEYGEDFEDDSKIAVVTPGTTEAKMITETIWKNRYDNGIITSNGCKKIPSITWVTSGAPAKTSIKSLKAGKKKITISYKKSKDATEYRIYRATKKKGPFTCVGTTTSTKFVDSGLKKGTTYYYKVVAVKSSAAKSDITAAASSVKSAKAQ